MTPSIDITLLLAVFSNMKGKVQYLMGAKAPSLDCDSHEIKAIDCSGFTRYALARATKQQLLLPDGSANQHDWCEARFSKIDYTSMQPSELYIAFIAPKYHNGELVEAGHVWLIRNGQTMESHGHAGVSTRVWATPILFNNVCACYKLPSVQ